jgi:hypothetical protein
MSRNTYAHYRGDDRYRRTFVTRRRGVVLGAVVLVVLAAAAVALFPRFKGVLTGPTSTTTESAGEEAARPRTSEELIAAALEAKDLTYEESLLARAYALFGDPRLEPAFRSPVVNWEAGTALFDEIEREQSKLSPALLASLLPFRVRPSDSRSIFNQPRAEVVRTQLPYGELARWSNRFVAGTNVRIWIKGNQSDLDMYAPMIKQIWDELPSYFPHPLPDDGPDPLSQSDPHPSQTNPDEAIDIYLMRGGELDIRCAEKTGPFPSCHMMMGAGGVAGAAEARRDRATRPGRKSGYVLADIGRPNNELIDAIAHEITHASQRQYDSEELAYSGWLPESTATWVGFKIVKKFNLEPTYEYGRLDTDAFFRTLHVNLPRAAVEYSSYLFFFHASIELGDRIVEKVWEKAVLAEGIRAVEQAMNLDEIFPRFTVRNWNQDGLTDSWRYNTAVRGDDSFPSRFRPGELVNTRFEGPGNDELTQPVPPLAARYYRFTFVDSIRKVTFENLFQGQQNAHVWALRKIGSDWKDPEDWTASTVKAFCRDEPTENINELVIIISNTKVAERIRGRVESDFPSGPRPIVNAEDVGCPLIEGSATSKLRLRDDRQDMSYVSSPARLRFRPRTIQDQTGNVQYDLLPTSVIWTASGRKNDCTVVGRTVVTIPAYLDLPLDPTRPAFGYLNVVGQYGGDYHSVQVSAVNPAASMTMTCPGNPPRVSQIPFDSVWLLNVISEKNTHDTGVVYKGTQTLDPANPLPNIPMSPGQAISTLPNVTPGIEAALREAQAALERIKAESGGKMVYTFEWALKPVAGAPAP